MNWKMIAAGGALVLAAVYGGITEGDLISSTIVCDGVAWVSSSILGENQSYAGSFFTSNIANISRELNTDNGISTTTNIRGSGAVGIDEYASYQATGGGSDNENCVFLVNPDDNSRFDHVDILSLMDHATYSSRRVLQNNQTTAHTAIDGEGMMVLREGSISQNQSELARVDLIGNMTMSDIFEFGGVL